MTTTLERRPRRRRRKRRRRTATTRWKRYERRSDDARTTQRRRGWVHHLFFSSSFSFLRVCGSEVSLSNFFFCRSSLLSCSESRPRRDREIRFKKFLSRTFTRSALVLCRLGVVGRLGRSQVSRRSFDFQILFSNITTRSEREDDRALRLAHNRARIKSDLRIIAPFSYCRRKREEHGVNL